MTSIDSSRAAGQRLALLEGYIEAHGRVVDACHGQPCHATSAPAGTGSASG
ncbi:MAG TPA: hypothetical protein VIX84_17760 [Acidimicrobiales bacterium]